MYGDDGGAAGGRQSRYARPDEDGGFDLLEWLDVDPTDGGAHAVTDPGETTDRAVDSGDHGFGFTDWLTSGEGDLAVLEGSGTRDGPPASRSDGLWGLPAGFGASDPPEVRPPMVAMLALFLTAATLAVLTVGGVLPPLGPVTGLPA